MNDARSREWLEADGLGGFASGTVAGLRTRRYHALLLAATTPPTGASCWSTASTPGSRRRRRVRHHAPSATAATSSIPTARRDRGLHDRAVAALDASALDDGTRVEHELFVPHGLGRVALSWRCSTARRPASRWCVRPFLSGRDYHALHHENGGFRSTPTRDGRRSSGARTPACRRSSPCAQRRLRARAGLVPQLPLRRGARARPRRRRGSRGAGRRSRFDLVGGRGASWLLAAEGPSTRLAIGHASSRRRRASRAGRARAPRAAFRTPPRTAPPTPTSCAAARGRTIIAGYPVVHRLGPRHLHRAARPLPRHRPPRRGARRSCSSGPAAVSEGHAAEPLPRRGERARIQRRRRLALVRDRRARATSSARPPARRVAAPTARALRDAVEAILDRLRRAARATASALDDDGLLARGRAGRAAHLDGRARSATGS